MMEIPQEIVDAVQDVEIKYSANEVVEILAHAFYYSINPTTKMNVPNNAYIYASKMLQKYGTPEAREIASLERAKKKYNEKDTQIA